MEAQREARREIKGLENRKAEEELGAQQLAMKTDGNGREISSPISAPALRCRVRERKWPEKYGCAETNQHGRILDGIGWKMGTLVGT
jgi:hypothetical protein